MKSNLLTGLLAAVAAILLPLVILGMAPPALPSDTPPERSAPEAPEASPAISTAQRTIQEFVVHRSRPAEEAKTPTDAVHHDSEQTVSVLISGVDTQMSLHDYLTGVLMGEVPASYEPEALKAQAVAARTYTLHRLSHGGTLSDDPAVCQAFLPLSSAPEKLGGDWEALLDKLHDAVSETDGLVLTYEGQLISATYFSGLRRPDRICTGRMGECHSLSGQRRESRRGGHHRLRIHRYRSPFRIFNSAGYLISGGVLGFLYHRRRRGYHCHWRRILYRSGTAKGFWPAIHPI